MTQIVVTGIARRKHIKRLLLLSKANRLEVVYHRFLPPIIPFVPEVDSLDPVFRMKASKRLRRIAIDGSKNPKLLLPFSWKSITLKINVEEEVEYNSQLDILEFYDTTPLRIFISKDVIRLGFDLRPNQIDTEYERVRNWFKYDLLLISGALLDKSFCLPVSPDATQNEIAQCVIRFKKSHFPTLQWAKNPSDLLPKPALLAGRAHTINQSVLIETGNKLVKFTKITNARFMHGISVYSGGEFFFSDSLKEPSWGSPGNHWPSYLYSVSNGKLISPLPTNYLPPLKRAIFIGGINNIMHFAIEDLQKLSALNSMGLDEQIPLLVNKNLSREIKKLIAVLSGCELIEVGESEGVEVCELYFPFFQNYLLEAIAGNAKGAELLYDKSAYQFARQRLNIGHRIGSGQSNRVLIRRESGLFRPLLNANKVQRMLEKDFEFTTHYVGDISLDQARSIFCDSEIIVGEYGAGLAHMLLLPTNAKVIEIRGPLERNSLEYEYFAKALELEHFKVIGYSRIFSKEGVTRGPYKINLRTLKLIIRDLLVQD